MLLLLSGFVILFIVSTAAFGGGMGPFSITALAAAVLAFLVGLVRMAGKRQQQ